MSTNVLGPALVLSTLLPLLAPDARVVNVTSGLGSLELLSNGTIGAQSTHYSVSKAALNMMTVHQARQVPRGVVVVCVDPGHVRTEMGGEGATVEVGESVRGVWEVIRGLKGEDNGKFFGVQGGGGGSLVGGGCQRGRKVNNFWISNVSLLPKPQHDLDNANGGK